MDQATLLQKEIAGAIMEELRRLGYMVDLSYFDLESKSVILMVRSPDEPKILFNVEIWKVEDEVEFKG